MTFSRDLEFYNMADLTTDLSQILREIDQKRNKSSKDGGKVLEVGTFDISLLKFGETKSFCDGIVARSNKEDLPLIGNFYRNILRILRIGRDEGIIDMTYFYYIKQLKILCLLPARKGVKWGTFKYYIQNVHSIGENFEMYPLFSRRIMEKFKRMGSITLIDAEIHIGNNSNSSSNETIRSPLNTILKAVKGAGGSRIKLEIYNQKREGGLKINPIKKIVDFLINLGILYNTESIKVRGSSTPEERDIIIDLIKNRYKLNINIGENSRHLIFEECRNKVNNTINGNLEEISKLVE